MYITVTLDTPTDVNESALNAKFRGVEHAEWPERKLDDVWARRRNRVNFSLTHDGQNELISDVTNLVERVRLVVILLLQAMGEQPIHAVSHLVPKCKASCIIYLLA